MLFQVFGCVDVDEQVLDVLILFLLLLSLDLFNLVWVYVIIK
jgi:hypothetical protein